jgi:protein required for attachment to host cells
MIWVVTSDSNTCRIYHFEKHPEKFTLIKEIAHPEIRLKKSEYLTSDKPGRYSSDTGSGGAYSPHSDPKEVEVDKFAREIAKTLDHGRTENAYKNLIIVTPPQMNGCISQHLDKHVKELIKEEIHKDVMHLSEHELLKFLKDKI